MQTFPNRKKRSISLPGFMETELSRVAPEDSFPLLKSAIGYPSSWGLQDLLHLMKSLGGIVIQ
jgi:hypothetical protein